MPVVHLHIGYPKCFSTTLQRSYFEKHPSIYYGGIGIRDNISYASEKIELCFESLLKYGNEAFWEKHKSGLRQHLSKFIEKAHKKRMVFSSEHLSMNFSLQGINNKIKYLRLKYLFQNYGIKILVIRRDPISLLRSLYGEYVKMGYDLDYGEFLKWVITFQDRNFLPDLNFELKNRQLCDLFGSENVHWLDFESIQKDGVEKSLNKELSNWLGIDDQFLPLDNNNPSLTAGEVGNLLFYNQNHPRGLSLSQTEPFESHRARLQYKYSNLDYQEEEIFSNVLAKQKALEAVIENTTKRVDFDGFSELENKVIKVIKTFAL